MELPEIARRIGTIDRTQIVYIEEYVLQYLRTYGYENILKGERISLYGKYQKREGINIYIIFTACREAEEQELSEKTSDAKSEEDYEKIGCLQRKGNFAMPDVQEEGANRIGPLTGYYIFYDANEKMKDYLAQYYENQLTHNQTKFQMSSVEVETIQIDQKNKAVQGELAELIAISCHKFGQPFRFYRWIRTAVVCIIIIFCAIAVTTINAHDKMEDFVSTIMQTSEWTQNIP